MNATKKKAYRKLLKDIVNRSNSHVNQAEQDQNASAGSGIVDRPIATIHPGEVGTESYLQELDLALIENDQHLVLEAREALKRIESGTYGRCEACHAPIRADRLRALPYARRCIRCAQLSESRQGDKSSPRDMQRSADYRNDDGGPTERDHAGKVLQLSETL